MGTIDIARFSASRRDLCSHVSDFPMKFLENYTHKQ